MRRRPCERCGLVFSGRRASARFCSDACRKASWRERTAGVVAVDEDAPAPRSLVAVDDAPALVAEAVTAGTQRGLEAVAEWLADTLDGLHGPARAVHGPKVASALTAVLKVLARPVKPEERPTSKLQALRDARAAADQRAGWAT